MSDHGEGLLILSDFAEHLGLRTWEDLQGWINAAGLKVIDKIDTKATHQKSWIQATRYMQREKPKSHHCGV